MRPQAASDFYRRQQALTVTAVASVRRGWGQIGRRWDDDWLDRLPLATMLLAAAQLNAARSAGDYFAEVTQQTGAGAATALVAAEAFSGVASDGRPLESLLYQPLVAAGAAYNAGASPARALCIGRSLLDLIVQTQIADAARVATQTWMAASDVQGYVRMLNPPSCDRCVVLAGKWFKWNEGFDRHPGDDCVHIPAREADYGDFRLSPDKYFHSLSTADQDEIFGEQNAEAIRLGADVGQVVNAKRGMTKASDLLGKGAASAGIRNTGREQLFTLEGTTRRGVYGSLASSAAAGYNSRRIGQYGYIRNQVERRTKRARLMPESIISMAENRADAIRLLTLYGYIMP